MPHGNRDYGIGAPKWTIYPLTDLGELAARLGSPVTFDRRGDVIWIEDFESSLNKWDPTTWGVGSGIFITNDRSRSGNFSCKMITGPIANDRAYMEHFLPLPVLSKMGIEFSFAGMNNIKYLTLETHLYEHEYQHHAHIRYDWPHRSLKYFDPHSTFHTFYYPYDIHDEDRLFNTLKAVIDFPNGKYDRVIVNDQSFDISQYTYYKPGPAVVFFLYIAIEITTNVNANAYTYIDDVIITQNEP